MSGDIGQNILFAADNEDAAVYNLDSATGFLMLQNPVAQVFLGPETSNGGRHLVAAPPGTPGDDPDYSAIVCDVNPASLALECVSDAYNSFYSCDVDDTPDLRMETGALNAACPGTLEAPMTFTLKALWIS